MHAQVNLVVYIINNTNGFQQPIAQTSLKIHDIYAHKPTRTWLSLNEPDQVSNTITRSNTITKITGFNVKVCLFF